MAWKVWGDPFETSDLTSVNVFQPIKFKQDLILRAMRTWFIVYNDPTFTDLCMKIYSNEVIGGANTPKKLLATSTNVQTKADIITLENGIKEVWFEFDYPVFNGNDIFNIVINGTGYSASVSSHLSWMKAFPKPVYTAGYTPTIESLNRAPYEVYAIGAEL